MDSINLGSDRSRRRSGYGWKSDFFDLVRNSIISRDNLSEKYALVSRSFHEGGKQVEC